VLLIDSENMRVQLLSAVFIESIRSCLSLKHLNIARDENIALIIDVTNSLNDFFVVEVNRPEHFRSLKYFDIFY
jgi:hypothetical protein